METQRLVLIFAVIGFASIGLFIGFWFVLGIYQKRLKKAANSKIDVPEKDFPEIIDYLKKIVDYGEPVRYGGVGIAALVALAASIVGSQIIDTSQITQILTIFIFGLVSFLGGIVFGDGLAALTLHDVFLEAAINQTDSREVLKEVCTLHEKISPWYPFKKFTELLQDFLNQFCRKL
jgi:hypothetical protein